MNSINIINFFSNFENPRGKIYKVRRNVHDKYYHKLFRFTRANVKFLADHFLPLNNETRGGSLSNVRRMEIFLRYISDPGFQVF